MTSDPTSNLRFIEPLRSKDGVRAEVYKSSLGGAGAVIIEADTATGDDAEVTLSAREAHDLMLWLQCALSCDSAAEAACNCRPLPEPPQDTCPIHGLTDETTEKPCEHEWFEGRCVHCLRPSPHALSVPAAHRTGTEPLCRLVGDLDWCISQTTPGHVVYKKLQQIRDQLRGAQETPREPGPMCSVCDHIEEMHKSMGASHPFTPKASENPLDDAGLPVCVNNPSLHSWSVRGRLGNPLPEQLCENGCGLMWKNRDSDQNGKAD